MGSEKAGFYQQNFLLIDITFSASARYFTGITLVSRSTFVNKTKLQATRYVGQILRILKGTITEFIARPPSLQRQLIHHQKALADIADIGASAISLKSRTHATKFHN